MAPEQSKRRRRWPWVLVAFLVAMPSCVAIHRYSLKRQIDAKIADIRAAGYPVTLEELEQWYVEPPAAREAAKLYAEAFAKFTPAEEPTEILLVDPWSTEEDDRAEFEAARVRVGEYVAANVEALKRLHAAAATNGPWWSGGLRAWTDEGLPPEFDDMRRATRLLSLEASVRLAEGDANAVVDSIVAVLSLSRPLRGVPLYLAHFSIPQISTGVSSLVSEALCNEVSLTDDQLEKLQGCFDLGEDDALWAKGLAGERCALIAAARRGELFEPPFGEQSGRVASVLAALGIRELDLLCLLGALDRLIELGTLPYPERLLESDRLKRDYAWLQAEFSLTSPETWFVKYYWFSRDWSTFAIVERAGHDAARERVARTALAVERFRIAAGVLPDDLADVVPRFIDAVPLDPFDGKPLRYQKLEKGYLLYSIGRDRVDDGGVPGDYRSGGVWTGDIAFTVRR